MTQPDRAVSPPPLNPPPFSERLNRTLCFFWLILNIIIFMGSVAQQFEISGGAIGLRSSYSKSMAHYNDMIAGIFIINAGYVLIYSLIVTIVYLVSGRLLNPFGDSTPTTFFAIALGGLSVALLFVVKQSLLLSS
jgi:hypothetical protein